MPTSCLLVRGSQEYAHKNKNEKRNWLMDGMCVATLTLTRESKGVEISCVRAPQTRFQSRQFSSREWPSRCGSTGSSSQNPKSRSGSWRERGVCLPSLWKALSMLDNLGILDYFLVRRSEENGQLRRIESLLEGEGGGFCLVQSILFAWRRRVLSSHFYNFQLAHYLYNFGFVQFLFFSFFSFFSFLNWANKGPAYRPSTPRKTGHLAQSTPKTRHKRISVKKNALSWLSCTAPCFALCLGLSCPSCILFCWPILLTVVFSCLI